MQVEVTNLSFSYESARPILREMDFHVCSGGSLAILGASGCGKSTILKIIAGIVCATPPFNLSGQIAVGNCDVINDIKSYRHLKSMGKIGYLSQTPAIFDHLSVIDNIRLPTNLIHGINKELIDGLVDLVGLGDHLKKLPHQLSGGMKTRTALARMFSTMPEILLLDEPFSSLDITRKSRIYSQFDALRGVARATTLLVTHDIFEAILFSERILVMGLDGSSQMYVVQNWEPNQSYSDVVSNHYSCFSKLKEMIE